MLLSCYIYAAIWILQVSVSLAINQHQQSLEDIEALQNKELYSRNYRAKRNGVQYYEDPKEFENIQEFASSTVTAKSSKIPVTVGNQVKVFSELSTILQKLLNKLNSMDIRPKKDSSKDNSNNNNNNSDDNNSNKIVITSSDMAKLQELRQVKRTKTYPTRKPRWGEWTPWSACSVSCGRGREIRWRHCLEECDLAETEMEEKTCQLPACGLGKIFGIQL